MKRYTLIALLLLSSMASVQAGEPKKTLAEQLPSLRLLQGPWTPGPVHRESVLFVQVKEGKPAARLLFDIDSIISVQRADGKQTFEAGKDFQVAPNGAGLVLLPESRIFYLKDVTLFPTKGAAHSIPHQTGKPDRSVYFGEGHFFHDQQIEVSYVPRKGAKWTGITPAFADKALPGTLEKLRSKKPLTIAVSGDSITQGYNASGYTKAAPHMPPYADLVAAQLEKTYGTKVKLHNRAIAGWSVGQGVGDVDKLVATKPDLVIIAYGMNDVGRRDPEGYKKGIAAIMQKAKDANPACEFVLVASMLGNPEWVHTPAEMFPKYRDALATLVGPGVALADMTAIWQKLLERKRIVDMTGNGVNHPNDYGHRLYAQTILALLVDPETARRESALTIPATPNVK